MSVGKLATALTVIFIVSVVILVAELLFVLLRHRSFRRQTSEPPISGDYQHPNYSAKELLYFFCLKPQTRVEPSGAPTENFNGPSPEDSVIDVFKLLEANGPSRVLCTIKEDDREEVESTSVSISGADLIPATEEVSLQTCLESEAAAERAAKGDVDVDEDMKTVLSSPCDSPMFFTPVGSPSQYRTSSEFVSPATGKSGACGL